MMTKTERTERLGELVTRGVDAGICVGTMAWSILLPVLVVVSQLYRENQYRTVADAIYVVMAIVTAVTTAAVVMPGCRELYFRTLDLSYVREVYDASGAEVVCLYAIKLIITLAFIALAALLAYALYYASGMSFILCTVAEVVATLMWSVFLQKRIDSIKVHE